MTLRSRIALALGVLAALAAIGVAVVGYVAIETQVRDGIDRDLDERAERFLEGDGRVLAALCLGQGTPRGRGPVDELVGRGTVVQCLGPGGAVLATVGDVALPVDATDEALTTGRRGERTRTVTIDGREYRIETVAVPGGGAVQVARDAEGTRDVLANLRMQFLVIGAAVTLAAVAAGWLIARRATRPLVRLTDAAEQVAETGRLDVELPPPGPDEPGRLSRSFAAMLAALRQSRDQQQQLVQDAGHELRTPLTSLRTNVETLRRHPQLPAESRDAILRDLDSESRELASLVDELVALATDTYADEPDQRVVLDELVARIAHRAARRTGRPVPVTVEGAPVVVVGRPRDLARAVGNLVDNAAKFSPPGTSIEVTVGPGRVVVRDHGPGVAEADRPRVFDRFYRSPEARAQPGSGLGLAIVDQTARAHGGSVTVADHPGGGAVFTLLLPAEA